MRKTIIILLSCIAVLLAGYAGYRSYQVWKSRHMMSLAHQFMAKADGRNALLCVQQVLRKDPHNLDATRVMAQITEAARSPSALLWWSRVVDLNPRSLDDRLAMAQTAVIMGDYATATNTLGGVDQAEPEHHGLPQRGRCPWPPPPAKLRWPRRRFYGSPPAGS